MSRPASTPDLVDRLARIVEAVDRIEHLKPRSAGPDAPAQEGCLALATLSLERLQLLVREMKRRHEADGWDTGDALLARMLLRDFRDAVRELRSVTDMTAAGLKGVSRAIDSTERFVALDGEHERDRAVRLAKRVERMRAIGGSAEEVTS